MGQQHRRNHGPSLLALLFLLLFSLAACGGAGETEAEAAPVQGPALIMFYTDG